MAARILVVDDEEVARRFTERVLLEGGFSCDTAHGVKDACAALSATRYDLLLTDLNLVDGTGTDLLRWVAEHQLFVPVVLMTGYPTVASAVDAMRLDAVDYLIKPCEDLAAAVSAAIARAHARRTDRNTLREWSHSLRALADRLDLQADVRGEVGKNPSSASKAVHPAWTTLSGREREVAERLVAGDSVREIARRLSISENTVRNHLKATYRKFEVNSQVELMRKIFGGTPKSSAP